MDVGCKKEPDTPLGEPGLCFLQRVQSRAKIFQELLGILDAFFLCVRLWHVSLPAALPWPPFLSLSSLLAVSWSLSFLCPLVTVSTSSSGLSSFVLFVCVQSIFFFPSLSLVVTYRGRLLLFTLLFPFLSLFLLATSCWLLCLSLPVVPSFGLPSFLPSRWLLCPPLLGPQCFL